MHFKLAKYLEDLKKMFKNNKGKKKNRKINKTSNIKTDQDDVMNS